MRGKLGLVSRFTNVDESFSSVSLLLHMDGTNGSTTFTDSSLNAVSVTANGNAAISTSQSKFGGASASFDGTGDSLSIASSSLFNLRDAFGNNPFTFTIECWLRLEELKSGHEFLRFDSSVAFPSIVFTADASGVLRVAVENVATRLTSSSSVSASEWNHIAVVSRLVSGSTTTFLYLNGSEVASGSDLHREGNHSVVIGSSNFNGYIDELRITKGVARYTANFTAPSSPFPDM